MPELPEVETTRLGIAPYVEGQKISKIVIRQPQLRWPVPKELIKLATNQTIKTVHRRAKYLLLETSTGHIIIHLGMSGSLRIVDKNASVTKHDHVDFILNHKALRFHDPRKFGTILWTQSNPYKHKLLQRLGPEPLSDEFNGEHMHRLAKQRKLSVKSFIMDSHIVVGVGNIYASEALFLSGIHPKRAASRISLARYQKLATNIKAVLNNAIELGGTTLKDFVREDGKPGYFANELNVYNKKGEPCPYCHNPIQFRVIGQRSSYYCSQCQH